MLPGNGKRKPHGVHGALAEKQKLCTVRSCANTLTSPDTIAMDKTTMLGLSQIQGTEAEVYCFIPDTCQTD
jgi:hypothetical protein